MKYGHYSDNEIPAQDNPGYSVNSSGYRCPEWLPLPDGKKNTVILGCSHTFGEGLDDGEVWVEKLHSLVDQSRLRFWNLGQPGASADKIVRILYATAKVLFPSIIIICWPLWSRRERLDSYAQSLMSYDPLLKTENENTDKNNFLKNVFFAEKFAEQQHAKLFHCFAQDIYEIPNATVYSDTSLRSCWPEWDSHHLPDAKRDRITTHRLAQDGLHYGTEHHRVFAEKIYNRFKSKLK